MKIKLYREKMNLSQIEAAAQLGVSKDVYNSWEYEIRIPRAKQMRKIFEWSGGLVTANDFYFSDENGGEKEKI